MYPFVLSLILTKCVTQVDMITLYLLSKQTEYSEQVARRYDQDWEKMARPEDLSANHIDTAGFAWYAKHPILLIFDIEWLAGLPI